MGRRWWGPVRSAGVVAGAVTVDRFDWCCVRVGRNGVGAVIVGRRVGWSGSCRSPSSASRVRAGVAAAPSAVAGRRRWRARAAAATPEQRRSTATIRSQLRPRHRSGRAAWSVAGSPRSAPDARLRRVPRGTAAPRTGRTSRRGPRRCASRSRFAGQPSSGMSVPGWVKTNTGQCQRYSEYERVPTQTSAARRRGRPWSRRWRPPRIEADGDRRSTQSRPPGKVQGSNSLRTVELPQQGARANSADRRRSPRARACHASRRTGGRPATRTRARRRSAGRTPECRCRSRRVRARRCRRAAPSARPTRRR